MQFTSAGKGQAQDSHHGTEQVLRQYADMSGHHVPMFAVADGPPGVAAQHLSPQERTSEGVHAPGPERTAMISRLQVSFAASCAEAIISPMRVNMQNYFAQ